MRLANVSRLSHGAAKKLDKMAQDRLVETYIDANPVTIGLAEARTKDEGVPVWALIGYLEAMEGDIQQVVHDYGLHPDAVQAALIYYHRNPAVIAARIEENRLLRAE